MNKNKIVYVILKELSEENRNFKSDDFGISDEQLHESINFSVREGLIHGGSILYADDIPHYEMAQVTIKGIEYLSKNSKWSKAYRGIKEIRDWMKL